MPKVGDDPDLFREANEEHYIVAFIPRFIVGVTN